RRPLHRLDAVLGEFRVEQRQGELGTDEGDVPPLAQQVRHRADVVLVGVRQDDGLDLVEPVSDVLEVGQDQVDARLLGIGEEYPAVDDQQAAGVLEDRHVPADLAQPAQRDDAQAATWQLRRGAEIRMRMAHARPPWSYRVLKTRSSSPYLDICQLHPAGHQASTQLGDLLLCWG